MPYNREAYARLRAEYETKYLRAQEAADLRRFEVEAAIPEIAEIDRTLRLTGLSIMEAALKGGDVESRIREVREKNSELTAIRSEILAAKGYPADYTDPRYECPLCNDSGFVDCKMCSCFREQLVKAGFELSGLGARLREMSFENFRLDYYAADPSAHRRMTQIRDRMRQYADTFEAGRSESLVLFGNTGLGKTHLSAAVAARVIERGHDVFFASAVTLLSDFEFQRFGNRQDAGAGEGSADTARYYDCDLLIVDDLGTEVTNQFTTSVLYNIINTRLNRRKATIISTNLSQEDFRRRYYDRITSRVLGEYQVLPFLGQDIRAQKLSR